MSFTLKQVKVWMTIAIVAGIIYGIILGWVIFVHLPIILGG